MRERVVGVLGGNAPSLAWLCGYAALAFLALGCDDEPSSSTSDSGQAGMMAMDMAPAAPDGQPMPGDQGGLVDAMAESDQGMAPMDAGPSGGAMTMDAGSLDAGMPDAADPGPDAALDLDAEVAGDVGLPDAEFAGFDLGTVDAGAVGCVSPEARFQFSVWPAVIDGRCTLCHFEGASEEEFSFAQREGSSFLLIDPDAPGRGQSRADVFAENLRRIMDAVEDDMGNPLLFPKALGQVDHLGLQQFAEGSEEHLLLLELVDLYNQGDDPECDDALDDAPTYQDVMGRLELRSAEETYRAFTIQTMGRLPNAGELNRIRSADDGGPGLMVEMGERDNAGQPGDRPDERPDANLMAVRTGLTMARDLIFYHSGRSVFRPWLKDMWNDAFLFRGIYEQDLDRPYSVYNPWDYGARVWSDLCGMKVPLTDEDGDYIDGPDYEPYCNREAGRFAYPSVIQPNLNGDDRNLTPEEACEYCPFSRGGIAKLMLYGAVEEPLELIAHIIQTERPFTDIVTTDTVMMNYYTSLVYFGTADPDENDFTADMDDVPQRREFENGPDFIRFEVDMPDHRWFKPMNRLRRTELRAYTPDGFENTTKDAREIGFRNPVDFPRAGVLTSAAFMKRFPSSDLNVNRHRAWQTMRLFLGFDILRNQGARISLADVDAPNGGATRRNADCVSCHVVLDPVSGLFRDFSYGGSSLSPNTADNRWPADLHPAGTAGIGGEDIVYDRGMHGPSIQFLGRQIAADPRFAETMVRYAWTQVMGHPPLEDVGDLDGRDFEARSTLLLAQQRFLQSLTEQFVRQNYNMRLLYAQLFMSTWYRIKGLSPGGDENISDAVYEGVGRHGTLTPEEYFRRLEAVYGEPWPLRGGPSRSGRARSTETRRKWDFFTRTDSRESGDNQFDLLYGGLDESFNSFFGGIDFQNNLTRAAQMNSVMSLVARRVANEFACLTVYPDLQKASRNRRFFGAVGRADGEGNVAAGQARGAIAHLFQTLLGQTVDTRGAEVTLAYGLFTDVVASVRARIEANPEAITLTQHCGINGADVRREPDGMEYTDPTGQIRGWMAVVTYLLLQPEFIQR